MWSRTGRLLLQIAGLPCEDPIQLSSPGSIELKPLCREAIRKQLLEEDPHGENLFTRIPKLGLPSIINDYLLYGVDISKKCEVPLKDQLKEFVSTLGPDDSSLACLP